MIGATGVFDLGHEAQPGRFEGGPVGADDGPAAGLHLVEAAELGAGEGGELGVVGGELGVGARRWSSALSALELDHLGLPRSDRKP